MGSVDDEIKDGDEELKMSVQKDRQELDDSAIGPIMHGQELAPYDDRPSVEDASVGIKGEARSIEQEICRKTYRGVPIFDDLNAHRYREVLESYESYMLAYESMAAMWKDHYANVQRAIDLAIGLSPSRSGKSSYKITPHEREKLQEIGRIAVFGCGFNPTRELSPKMIQALADGLVELILVDFSRKSLRSSINFFLAIGIKPKAAYQMDLTMGTAAYINSYATNLKREMDEAPGGCDLNIFIDLIDNEVDSIIEAYEKGRNIPGFFNNYPMNEDDRPGLAVSTMVTAATFLTIYDYLLKIVKKSEMADVLIEKLRAIHAKFNAFVLRLNATKIAELSKDNSNVLIITDVNKVNLPSAQITNDVKPADAESIRNAINALVNGSATATDSLLAEFVDNEIRMSRDGRTCESLEEIVRSVAAIRDATFVTLGPGKHNPASPRNWMWWDDPGNESDDPGHGHEVHVVNYRLDKGVKRTIIGLFKNLPADIIASGDPVAAAHFIKDELTENNDSEACLRWLVELNIPLEDVPPDDMLDRHRPYMNKGAYQIIDQVPREDIERGWEQALAYLQKEYDWQNDGITRGHIKTGMDWLRRFVKELRKD
ncbi:hypothetical protein KJ951_00335 [Patescibacteria group bacterium]|nr:hypothetical protein [Patescibacteria group bacterium]MBU1702832.1 hypothetical protein [Patescibacteria group bacterium]MBU1954280.1 hypothetical protein [Patescibacteria group bacterium]